MKTLKKRGARLLQLTVVLALFLTMSMQSAFASYTLTSIQCTIDDVNWQIVAGVVDDKYAWTDSHILEGDRIGKDVLRELAENDGSTSVGARLLSGLDVDSARGGYHGEDAVSSNLIMTFPGSPKKGTINPFKSSTEYDKARATVVKDVLLYDLNLAYQLIYEGESPSNISDYKNKMVSLLDAVNGGSINGYSFSKGTTKSSFADKSMSSSDYVTISKDGMTIAELAYRIPKGYVSVEDYTPPSTLSSSNGDVPYITWGELAYEAFANYSLDEKLAITVENVYSSTANSLESAVAGMLGNLFNWLAGALGLWNLDDLVLNGGIRSTSAYIGGIFPATWESTIWTFFFIAEVIALIVLSFAVLLGIYKKAMSTVNPMMRASFMDQMKNTFIAIFAIILMPALLRLLIQISATFTNIFAVALDEKTATEALSVYAKQSGTLGGVLIQFVYLGALLYFNFFYYMRALTMAALIILSPIAILCTCFGENSRHITRTWFNILLSTVLIQPIHALCLVILLLLPNEGRMFQNIIGIYAMIPLTQTLINMFIKEGTGVHVFASKGQGASTMLMKVGAMSAAGAVGGAVGSFVGAKTAQADGKDYNSEVSGVNTKGSAAAEAVGRGASGAETSTATENVGAGAYGTGVASAMGTSYGRQSVSTEPSVEQRVAANNNSPETQSLLSDYQAASGAKAYEKGKNGAMLAGGVALSAVGGALSPWGLGRNMSQMGSNIARTSGRRAVNLDRSYESRIAELDGKGTEILGKQTNSASTGVDASAGFAVGADAAMAPSPVNSPVVSGPLNIDSTEGEDPRICEMYANPAYTNQSIMDAYEQLPEAPDAYSAADFTDAVDGRVYASNDGLKGVGMSVEKGSEKGEKIISYSAANLSPRDRVQMESIYETFQHGTDAQKQTLVDSGITGISAEKSHNTGATKGYVMQVNSAKLKENYGIDLKDRKMGSYVTSFGSAESIVPNVISTEKIRNRQVNTATASPADAT